MSYVPIYHDGRVPQRALAGLGADAAPGVPPYVTAIIREIESRYPLNTDSIQKLMDAFSKALSEEAKREAIERAAVAAGLAVADIILTATVVGTVVAVLITVVMAVINAALKVTQSYYSNQANQLVADTQNYLRTLAAEYNAKLLAFQSQVIDQEAPAAYQLAVSGATLNGLGAWQANLARDMRRAVTMTAIVAKPIEQFHHVAFQALIQPITRLPIPAISKLAAQTAGAESDAYADMQRYHQNVDNFIKVGTGEATLDKTQEAVAKCRAAGEIEFEKQYQIALANSDSPPFRAALRTGLAAIFRTDPTINSLMSQLVASVANGTTASLNMSVKEPSKGLQAVPMVATGIAAAAALMFFKR